MTEQNRSHYLFPPSLLDGFAAGDPRGGVEPLADILRPFAAAADVFPEDTDPETVVLYIEGETITVRDLKRTRDAYMRTRWGNVPPSLPELPRGVVMREVTTAQRLVLLKTAVFDVLRAFGAAYLAICENVLDFILFKRLSK